MEDFYCNYSKEEIECVLIELDCLQQLDVFLLKIISEYAEQEIIIFASTLNFLRISDGLGGLSFA